MEKIVFSYEKNNHSADRKNCLLILPRPIFPLISGYSNKNYNLIDGLSKQYNLTLIILISQNLCAEEIAFYEKRVCNVSCFLITKREKYIGSIKSLFSRKPLQVGYYYRKEIANQITQQSDNMDIAIAALVRTIKYLDDISSGCKKVFDMVDSIGLNYINSLHETSSVFWRLLYMIEGRRLLKYEKEKVKTSDCTFFISEKERKYYQQYGKTVWLPHGVKESLFIYDKFDASNSKSIAFIGKMDYQPNIDAVKWYVKNVHSRIADQVPFIIIGANPTEEILDLGKKYPNITITGYCEDPYIYLYSAMAVVAPMLTGGGIQNKVLEGMALGKINILTSLAAEPITGAEDKKHYLVANTAEDYCSVIKNIVSNQDEYKDIGIEARKFIQNNFTWRAYNNSYISALEEMKK